jgi:hypothetical protein
MKEGKRKEGEETKASGPTASPVLAPAQKNRSWNRHWGRGGDWMEAGDGR